MTRYEIQAALIARVKAFEFPAVKYASNGLPEPVIESGNPVKVLAKSVLCNEIHSRFEVDRKDGRKFTQRKAQWRFPLEATFDREVDLDAFDQDYCNAPTIFAADGSSPATFVLLSEANYRHAVTQGGTGTEALFVFVADSMRR